MSDLMLRLYTFKGKESDESKQVEGVVEAHSEVEAMEILSESFIPESLELEDQGPIGLFALSADGSTFQKATEEQFRELQTADGTWAASKPSPDGRVWDVHLRDIQSAVLLRAFSDLMQGGSQSSNRPQAVLMTPLGAIPIATPEGCMLPGGDTSSDVRLLLTLAANQSTLVQNLTQLLASGSVPPDQWGKAFQARTQEHKKQREFSERIASALLGKL